MPTWGGVFIRPSYARDLITLCHKYGVKVLVDECFTGWRCGHPLLCLSPAYALDADAITFGKCGLGLLILKEDMPSVVVNSRHNIDMTINGQHCGSRAGSPLAAGLFEQLLREVFAARSVGVLVTHSPDSPADMDGPAAPLPTFPMLQCVVSQSESWRDKLLLDLKGHPQHAQVQWWSAGLLCFTNIFPHLRTVHAWETDALGQDLSLTHPMRDEFAALVFEDFRGPLMPIDEMQRGATSPDSLSSPQASSSQSTEAGQAKRTRVSSGSR